MDAQKGLLWQAAKLHQDHATGSRDIKYGWMLSGQTWYSPLKPRKSLSLPLKSSPWLFSLDASLSSYKSSSSVPSSALLMPHFLNDFTKVLLLTRCQEFFTHSQILEIEGHCTLPAVVRWWVGSSIHFVHSSCINPLNGSLNETNSLITH